TVEVRQPFFREEIQRQRDAQRRLDAARPFAQVAEKTFRIGIGWRSEQLRWEPEHPLLLVHHHERVHGWFEVGNDLDLGQEFRLGEKHERWMNGDWMTARTNRPGRGEAGS